MRAWAVDQALKLASLWVNGRPVIKASRCCCLETFSRSIRSGCPCQASSSNGKHRHISFEGRFDPRFSWLFLEPKICHIKAGYPGFSPS